MTQHFHVAETSYPCAQGTAISAAVPIGTEILTMDGVLPVEFLSLGDQIITRSSGAMRLRALVRHKVPTDMRMVRIAAEALGGKPDRETLLPPRQRVLIRDWRAQALWGADQARVAIARLIDDSYITWTDERPTALFEMQFDQAEIIYANGLELMTTPAKE